jgi:threonine dehydratase
VRRFAEANNAVYISPYNDVKMIAGKKVILLITGCRIDLKTLKKFLEV